MVKKSLMSLCTLLLLTVALGERASLQCATSKEAQFYNGKVIEFVVPYNTGAGYDIWARTLAPYLKKHTGATVIIKNLPGAGGLIATNKLFTTDPNGLTIGILNGFGIMQSQITGVSTVKYDVTKFTWLGRVTAEQKVMTIGNKGRFKTLEAMRKSKIPVKLGAGGIGDSAFVEQVLISEALGINNDLILGYDSSAETDLAVIRGEIDATTGSFSSKIDKVKNGDMHFVAQFGSVKMAELANVPDVAGQPDISEENRQYIVLLTSLAKVGRAVAAPPGLSPEKTKFLQEALRKSLEEPQFITLAKRQNMEIIYMTSAELLKTIYGGINLNPTVKNKFVALLEKYRTKK